MKNAVARSETWLSAISVIGAVVTAYTSHIEGAATWVALGISIALAAVFAFFRTALAAKDKPGIKTKAFWTSVVVILGSIATAVAETDIAGVPAKVTQVAGMIAAFITAAGYHIWRTTTKRAGSD